MKKLICQAALILSSIYVLPACSKNASIITSPPPPCNPCNPGTRETQDSSIYNLKIYNWITVPNSGVYTYDIGTLKVPAAISSSPQVSVYLLDGSKATRINEPVNFMGGSIWTIINGLNVKIIYRNESGQTYIPFTNLTVKIEIN